MWSRGGQKDLHHLLRQCCPRRLLDGAHCHLCGSEQMRSIVEGPGMMVLGFPFPLPTSHFSLFFSSLSLPFLLSSLPSSRCCFGDRISLCSPDWLGTLYPPASAFHVLGLQHGAGQHAILFCVSCLLQCPPLCRQRGSHLIC